MSTTTWQCFTHVVTTHCWRIKHVSVTVLERIPGSLCLVSPILHPMCLFPLLTLLWVFFFAVIIHSCEYYYMLSPVSPPINSSNLGMPPKSLPLPPKSSNASIWVCARQMAQMPNFDSISHVKPFLDFNSSVFSLSWFWRKLKHYRLWEKRRQWTMKKEKQMWEEKEKLNTPSDFEDYKTVSLAWARVRRIQGVGRNGVQARIELD